MGSGLLMKLSLKGTGMVGGSVMIWGGISTHHRTVLYNVDGNLNDVRYQAEILQPLVLPALHQLGPAWTMQSFKTTVPGPIAPEQSTCLSKLLVSTECSGPQTARTSTPSNTFGMSWDADFNSVALLLQTWLSCFCRSSRSGVLCPRPFCAH